MKKLHFLTSLTNHLSRHWLTDILLLLTAIYLGNRLYRLTSIPVFADEAIYIYWSQLAASEWDRYAFMSMNDGKTPLVIWLMIPLLRLLHDPLVAGRLVAVAFGLGQMIVTMMIVSLFTPKRRYQLLAGLLVILSPGLMLNNRLALMDSASSFFVSLTFLSGYIASRSFLVTRTDETFRRNKIWCKWTLIAGVSFGLSLWAKFSNILLAPVLITILLYDLDIRRLWDRKAARATWINLFWLCLPLAAAGIIGLAMFAILKISPSFPGIFSRGGDFLYPLSDFWTHPLEIIVANLTTFWQVLTNYAGSLLWWTAWLLAVMLATKKRPTPLLILLSGLAYAVPIIILGKVVYPRYYLPVVPFVIVSLCVSLSQIRRLTLINFKFALIFLFIGVGVYYSWGLHFAPASVALLPADRTQLFLEWSAGYGIKETVELLEQLGTNQKILVLTEGHVGTLPDGLQIYLWQSVVRNNLKIIGLGAPPVRNFASTDEDFADYDQVLLVVNAHRLELDDGIELSELVAEYPRPEHTAPTLQVWRVQ